MLDKQAQNRLKDVQYGLVRENDNCHPWSPFVPSLSAVLHNMYQFTSHVRSKLHSTSHNSTKFDDSDCNITVALKVFRKTGVVHINDATGQPSSRDFVSMVDDSSPLLGYSSQLTVETKMDIGSITNIIEEQDLSWTCSNSAKQSVLEGTQSVIGCW